MMKTIRGLAMSVLISTGAAAQDGMPLTIDGWRLVTDGVMGGVSRGQVAQTSSEGEECVRLTGVVSTDNNGGFLQVVKALDKATATRLQSGGFDGLRLRVRGNDERYNVHLRTRDLWLPWQAYRATFETTPQWRTIELPFADFKPYRTSTRLDVGRIKRVGLVAIGRDFEADLCVAKVGFYRAAASPLR